MRGEAGPGRLRHRVLHTIRERELWEPGQRVAIACSGGHDSMALLDLLVQTQGAHGGLLSVVTVDHGTRPGSAVDADFVRETAEARGLRVEVHTLQLGPQASEELCRDARYAVFEELAVDRVALAHHREDQAETVLLHLLRGTGTRGLAAMGWRASRRVRPLLDVARTDLEAWARMRQLVWRDDPSNADPRFLRNRVRAELVPLLEELRPGAVIALARSAGIAAQDDQWLTALVDAAREQLPEVLEAAWVAEQPAALVGRVLRARVPQAHASHVLAIRHAARRGSGVVELPDGRRWEVRGEGVFLVEAPTSLD